MACLEGGADGTIKISFETTMLRLDPGLEHDRQ